MTEPTDAPRHYAWPKYVLAAVALFFTVCTWWTITEVRRLQRAKAGGMEMRSLAPATPPAPFAQPTTNPPAAPPP